MNLVLEDIAEDFELWGKHIDPDGLLSEEDFYCMDLEEKLQTLLNLTKPKR